MTEKEQLFAAIPIETTPPSLAEQMKSYYPQAPRRACYPRDTVESWARAQQNGGRVTLEKQHESESAGNNRRNRAGIAHNQVNVNRRGWAHEYANDVQRTGVSFDANLKPIGQIVSSTTGQSRHKGESPPRGGQSLWQMGP